MQVIRSLLFNLIFYSTLVLTSICILFMYPLVPTKQLQIVTSKWIYFILQSLKKICGVRWRIKGIENIPSTPCILVSNHQGPWESLFLQTLFIPCSSIIKRELLLIPFFGWALLCLKPISLTRSNKIKSIKKVLSEGKKRLSSGFSIIIFPEGTRARPEKGIKSFSSSCSALSLRNNVPLIPICHNSGKYWKNRKFNKVPGIIDIVIGKPIESNDIKKMTAITEEWVKSQYSALN